MKKLYINPKGKLEQNMEQMKFKLLDVPVNLPHQEDLLKIKS